MHNIFLLQTYDTLVKKYYSSIKVKEDIIRYIIRKVLKTSKKIIKETEKVKGKKASILLCKRYFPEQFELITNKTNSCKEEEILKILMPFNQKSKNKTMNTNFVKELFSSQAFLKDYQGFLQNLGVFLGQDNTKKSEKLLDVLVESVKKNNFKKIGTLKVFPWLESCIEDTKKTAQELWQGALDSVCKQNK